MVIPVSAIIACFIMGMADGLAIVAISSGRHPGPGDH